MIIFPSTKYSHITDGVECVPFVIETSSVWCELGEGAGTTDGGSQLGATLYEVSASAPVGYCSARKRCLYFRNIASSGPRFLLTVFIVIVIVVVTIIF